MAEKNFSPEEAERLLPQLDGWLRAIIESKRKITETEAEGAGLARRITITGGMVLDVSYWIRRKQEEEKHGENLRAAAHQIENCGCLLKDLDTGLVDFPCEVDGMEVYLCWKLGEPTIGFWHPTNEGFAGRRPIDRDFLEHFKPQRPM